MSGRFAVIPTRVLEDERITITHLRVLVAIGSYSDKNGWSFFRSRTIAERLNLSGGRIRTCLGDLKEWGYIEVFAQYREDGSQMNNHYRMIVDIDAPPVGLEGSAAPEQAAPPPSAAQTPPPSAAQTAPSVYGADGPVSPKDRRPPSAPGADTINTPLKTPHRKDPSEHRGSAELPEGFGRFWAAYAPAGERRTNRKACLKLWQSGGLEAHADRIVEHVQACAKSRSWLEGFAPMAETYLRQERFNDTPPAPPGSQLAARAAGPRVGGMTQDERRAHQAEVMASQRRKAGLPPEPGDEEFLDDFDTIDMPPSSPAPRLGAPE